MFVILPVSSISLLGLVKHFLSLHFASYTFFFLLLFCSSCAEKVHTNRQNEPSAAAKKRAPKGRQTLYITVDNPNKVLWGNSCVTSYTNKKMGFEYVVTPKMMIDDPTGLWLENFWVRTRLTFRNGPFWGIKVKKRIRRCRQSSGDFKG